MQGTGEIEGRMVEKTGRKVLAGGERNKKKAKSLSHGSATLTTGSFGELSPAKGCATQDRLMTLRVPRPLESALLLLAWFGYLMVRRSLHGGQ